MADDFSLRKTEITVIGDESESGVSEVGGSRSGGKDHANKGDESGSDIDAIDLKMMEQGFTQLEMRLKGSTRTIAIPIDRDLLKNTENIVPSLRPLCSEIEGKTLKELETPPCRGTVILEIESARREEKRREIFALRDELKEKGDELVIFIKNCSVLEGTLRSREEKLKVSRAAEAHCGDLQAQVVELHRELEECPIQIKVLHGKVAEKQSELEKVESSRLEARRKSEKLELANRTLRVEWDIDQSTVKYHDNYWEFHRRFGEGGNMQALRDELKEKGDKLAQVVELYRKLEECQIQIEVLHGKVAEKQSKLEKAESSRLEARRKSEMLELANRTLWVEWEIEQSTEKVKEDRLEERIGELEKDNSLLHDRVVALEAEKAKLLVQPSSSRTLDFPNIFRELYE
nr:early endosome antigen 1-like [Nicotiana tomentosiformis]